MTPSTGAPTPTRSWTGRLGHACGQLFVIAATLSGLCIGGWWYLTTYVDRELAAEVEKKLGERLGLADQAVVRVGGARRVEGRGIELRHVSLARQAGAAPWIEIDELWLICNAEIQDLINGHLHVRHITARHVRVRATLDQQGQLEFPRLQLRETESGGEPTTITLEDGSLELVDSRRPMGKPLVVRGIELDWKRPSEETLKSYGWSPALPWHVRAQCSSEPLQDSRLEALFDGATGDYIAKGDVHELRFSAELLETLPLELAELLQPAAGLRGRLKGEFRVEQRRELATRDRATKPTATESPASPPLRFSAHGELIEGRVEDSRFETPLTDLRGKFHLDEQGLAVEEVTARAGEATLFGWLRREGYTSTSPLTFELRARKFHVGPSFYELVPADWRETITRYGVEGPIHADIKGKFDGRNWTPDLTLQFANVTVECQDFPYRLTGGTGFLEYRDGILHSTRLQALADGAPVRVDIQIADLGANYTGHFEVVAETPIPVDEKLLTALDDDTERLLRSLKIRGATTVHARFERKTREAPLSRRIRVGIHQGAVQYDHFRYPLERVRGAVIITDAGWEIEELAGENNSAYVECRGGWQRVDARRGDLRLDFLATDVPLDEELQAALPASGQRWWTQFRPRGTLDLVVISVRAPPGAERPRIEATIEKRNERQNVAGRSVSVKPVAFPYPVDNITGIVRYQPGEFTLEQLRGEHGRAVLQGAGRCLVTDTGEWRLKLQQVSVDRLQIDHDLLSALPTDAGLGVARAQFSGPIRGQGTLELDGSVATGGVSRGAWDIVLDVENGGLHCGVPLEQIRGELRLTGQRQTDGAIATRGELNIDSLVCRGIQFSSVRGPITLVGRQMVFGDAWAPPALRSGAPRPVTAHVFGGAIVGDAILALGDDVGFRVEALLSEADLAMLAREALSRRRDIQGKASAAVRLEGNSRGSHTLRGDGWLKCRDADIDQLPATGAMLKQLNNRNAGTRNLSLSDVDFRIQDNCFYLPRIDFKGEGITLKGHGEMLFNRSIDLKFYSVAGRDEVRLPVLSPVLAEASRQIMEIEVTGTLDDPEVRRHVVPVINDALQQMFPELGERPADRTPLLRRFGPPKAAPAATGSR